MNHWERTQLQDPNRLTGYSCTEMSKPQTFSPWTRSAKWRLSPNSQRLLRLVLISSLRMRFSWELYLTLSSFTKSPSTSTYLLTLHFARNCPGIATSLPRLASASSQIARTATSRFLAELAWSSSQMKNPTMLLFVLPFSASRSSKWFLPPSTPAKSRRRTASGGTNSSDWASVSTYCLRFLLLFWWSRCRCQAFLNLLSSLTALLRLSSSSLAWRTSSLFLSSSCSFWRWLLFSLWMCSFSFCRTAFLSSSTSRSSWGSPSSSSLESRFSLRVDSFSLHSSSFLLYLVLIEYMLFITFTDWNSFSLLTFCSDSTFFRSSLFSCQNYWILGSLRISSYSCTAIVLSSRAVSLFRSLASCRAVATSASTFRISFSTRSHSDAISSVALSALEDSTRFLSSCMRRYWNLSSFCEASSSLVLSWSSRVWWGRVFCFCMRTSTLYLSVRMSWRRVPFCSSTFVQMRLSSKTSFMADSLRVSCCSR